MWRRVIERMLRGEIYIQCCTEQEAIDLFKQFQLYGVRWRTGGLAEPNKTKHRITEPRVYGVNRDELSMGLSCGPRDYYDDEKYPVTLYSDILYEVKHDDIY